MSTTAPRVSAVDEAAALARTAVALVTPRLRGVLHEAAFPVSILGGAWAVFHADSAPARISTAIYAVTLAACLGVSALYHRGHWSVRMRAWLRRLDRTTIYLLIAGTFTPLAVIELHGWVSILTLVVVWGSGLVGSIANTLWSNAPVAVEVVPYLAVGGFGVVLLPGLLTTVAPIGVALLALGGAIYVSGAIVYAWQRPNPWPRTFGFHEIFHTLVIAAAVLQWVGITYWVLPAA